MDQSVGDLKEMLKDNLRAKMTTKLYLNYVENEPVDAAMDCICRICGNEEPTVMNDKYGEDFLNAHALEKFFSNADDQDDLCKECAYLQNLNINIDKSDEAQTVSQPYLLVTGIFLSPAFWIIMALPHEVA